MKLRFSIHYRTEWGQQLVVCISYSAQDGSVRTARLPMLTDDGDYWTGETVMVESRRMSVDSFTYFYIVADSNGKELRREWMQVPRTYSCDASKTFVFFDQWRDLPLNSHLYTSAYEVSRQGKQDAASDKQRLSLGTEGLSLTKLPLFRKTILFRVSAPQLQEGQSLAIVGSHPALGSWNAARYMLMEYAGMKDWMVTLNVDWIGGPLEYKYVVVDQATHELLAWEEGNNRVVTEDVTDGEVLVLYGEQLRLSEKPWRVAGVCVPVFALRSEHSYGVGDFGDLRRLVDWAVATGMKVIQLLPVNDTTVSHHWGDSNPYKTVSAFALHPHFMDLEQLGTLKDKKRMTVFRRRQRELNALSYSDYEAVERVKTEYVTELFKEIGEQTLCSNDYETWFKANKEWLKPYAEWMANRVENVEAQNAKLDFYYFVQYHLHCQLKAAVDYAHSKGVFLKGDLPIGIHQTSVETATHPAFFNLDMQTGTPPDAYTMQGQNWETPTYDWEGDREKFLSWFQQRLRHMEQYFDALRLDHVQGYFLSWEIPQEQLFGTMGHYSPAMPFAIGEIEYFGLPFRKELFTRPFINDRVVDRLFGIHASYVRDTFLVRKSYGLYELKEEVNTQRKVRDFFAGKEDENSLWIRDALYRLVANVLFLEDPRLPEMYHPRMMAYKEPVFEALNNEERDAYMRIYNNFFYQRHSMFWGTVGYERLKNILSDTHMLACAEDLGALPECVEPVLQSLRILTLEIQRMPKMTGMEFSHLDGNPVKSVATISTHDMAPLRLWWEESPERAQRFYATMLQKQGRAPQHLPAHLAEEMIARHLYSPSMLCILALQDWLAMDSELWNKNPREERINVPSSANEWKYRMHLTIEQLMAAERYNKKVRTMVARSKR